MRLFPASDKDPRYGVEDDQQGKEIGYPGKIIAMPGIKCKFVINIKLSPQGIWFPVGCALEDLTLLVDQGSDARVG